MKKSEFVFQCVMSLALFMAVHTSSYAKELAGVSLKDQITVQGIDSPLKLNGAGIRYKFFFKIYVGALYLPEKQTDAATVLKSSQANRILMHFIYDDVPKKKLVDAWLDGFENNNNKAAFDAVKSRLYEFNDMFSDVKKDDVVLLDYVPGKGTRVSIKGVEKGVIEGHDFNRALLSVWLGEEPVTEELKDAMLGIEED